ncbi:hypothetical protein PS681_00432 [Pseudomonas fluorescens]|nr:hypothetical protein PS681_00432 [Pseudomonas fluorescens]
MTGFDVRQHGVHLLGIHQRADVGRRVQRIARLPGFQRLDHHRQESVLDRTLDQQTRTGGADFALVEGNGAGRRLCCRAQIRCVGKHHVRALAPCFEPDAFHVALACINHQLLGNRRGAGEGQHVDVHVQRQRFADGVAEAWQDVEHAFRNAGIQRQLRDADRRQRRFFRRFQNKRIARRQCRGEFPAGHDQREVPRHDGRDHAGWLASDEAELIMRCGGDFVVDLVDGFGAPADRVGGRRDIDAHRIADRFTHVEGFQQRQFFLVLQDQIGEADQDALALGRGFFRPDAGLERLARDFDGEVGIGFIGAGHGGEETAVDGAQAFERVATDGRAVFTVDERAGFDGQGLEALFPVVAGRCHCCGSTRGDWGCRGVGSGLRWRPSP